MTTRDETKHTGCPIEATLNLIGGRWKPLILYHLSDDMRRFNELKRLMPQVSRHMLTQHLRELEADGLVHRKVYAEVPPRVEYRLTQLSQRLQPLLLAMHEWGEWYLAEADNEELIEPVPPQVDVV